MKVNIKTLAIAIAAILTIGSVTLVSCNKDEETLTSKVATSAMPGTKGSSRVLEIRDELSSIYTKCDEAYKKDSITFSEICFRNDSTMFLEFTGITKEQVEKLNKLCGDELKDFLDIHPEIVKDESPCYDCIENALYNLGKLVISMQGHTATLVPSVISGDNYWQLMLCEFQCAAVPPCGRAFCLASCIGKYWRSYDGIKYNMDISLQTIADNSVRNLYSRMGNNIVALDENDGYENSEYILSYTDDNEIEMYLADTDKIQLHINGAERSLVLKDIKQSGTTVQFDLFIDDIFFSSCVMTLPESIDFIGVMTSNKKASAIGLLAKEIGKIILQGAIPYVLESIFGGNDAASKCYKHMEKESNACVNANGLPQVQHTNGHNNCSFKCNPK